MKKLFSSFVNTISCVFTCHFPDLLEDIVFLTPIKDVKSNLDCLRGKIIFWSKLVLLRILEGKKNSHLYPGGKRITSGFGF